MHQRLIHDHPAQRDRVDVQLARSMENHTQTSNLFVVIVSKCHVLWCRRSWASTSESRNGHVCGPARSFLTSGSSSEDSVSSVRMTLEQELAYDFEASKRNQTLVADLQLSFAAIHISLHTRVLDGGTSCVRLGFLLFSSSSGRPSWLRE
ncbi:uncharacterized protein [Physcomitrium patens]|uniref:uncharacterized protein isoform X1 n=1 Tax=Physcomitrium patens TaxID=3218 RepID=UPI000D17E1AF|nr:uncharacterized protein LOC112279828 isoform X1 [Physcomitrium patens]|eukprot:XP_024370340.1 uncharacterized protein LOC112279828 isoform X1 [Physcomitrella patens]